MGMMQNLRKKHPEADKIVKQFLESPCCEEDEEASKKEKKNRRKK